jgi:hypothetical protein
VSFNGTQSDGGSDALQDIGQPPATNGKVFRTASLTREDVLREK